MPEDFGLNRVPGDRPQQMDYQQHSSPTFLTNIHQHGGHALVHALGQQALQIQNDNENNSKWSQYHHLWRQHMIINGKSTKEIGGEEKKEDGELWCNIEAQAAFLGPNLWDKTLPYDTDFKEHSLQYVDLDEFLSENGITTGEGVQPNGGSRLPLQGPEVLGHEPPMQLTLTKRERSPSPSPCEPLSPATLNPCSPADSTMSMASSGREFDPRTRTFSDEELKPQPMVKKSRKQFVPDDLKDEKYWARRRKNNMAAKRSRDARRMKENQIALRAGFLEKENMGLKQELDRLKKENLLLRDKLSKYAGEV